MSTKYTTEQLLTLMIHLLVRHPDGVRLIHEQYVRAIESVEDMETEKVVPIDFLRNRRAIRKIHK